MKGLETRHSEIVGARQTRSSPIPESKGILRQVERDKLAHLRFQDDDEEFRMTMRGGFNKDVFLSPSPASS